MDQDKTIPSNLMSADFDQRRKRQSGVHPIFLIMLGAVILLFIVVTVKGH